MAAPIKIIKIIFVYGYFCQFMHICLGQVELNDQLLEKRKDGMWLVEFYAPWCGHCKKLEPIYHQVYLSLRNSGIIVGKIDSTRYSSVASEFDVRGFPTIKFINGEKVYTHRGDRSKEDIIDFATKAKGPSVRKTRMQSLVPNPKADYRSLYDALHQIVRHEGMKNTLRGINSVVSGAGPAHAMYFACYEKLKKTFSSTKHSNHLAHGAAGCVATVLHDIVMNPADVVKQRMQMFGSPYKTCLECARTTVKQEGIGAFYRSFTTQLTMNIPFQCVHFMIYEFSQDILNKERRYDPSSHVISGGLAGAVAATVTMPLDVCKTLLNTQEQCARTRVPYINGMASAFRTVYEFQGFTGYFRGLQARVIYQIPSTAISWSVYEFFKYIITKKKTDDDRYLSVNNLPVHVSASPK